MEALIVRMFAVAGVDLPLPFPRMAYDEAIDTMGSYHPDTHFGLRFVEATDIFRNTSYGIFKQILQRDGSIRINDRDVQRKIFQAMGLRDQEVGEKFGFFPARPGLWRPPLTAASPSVWTGSFP